MLSKLLLLVLASLPVAALADDNSFHGWAECTGKSKTVTVSIKIGVFAGGNSAHFSYVDSAKPGEPWVFDVNPSDIMAASVGWQFANFAHGHHNTILKLMADGDIFGRPTRDDSSAAPYYGRLFLQTGNDRPTKESFKVACKNDLQEE